jgi:ribose transport system substrate-binding protein
MANRSESERYLCRSISRACETLDAFREETKALSLTEIASKTGLSAATAFRILYTLERHGLVTRVAERQYVLNIKLPKRSRYRIGYAGQSQEFSFARLVAEGITKAAEEAEIDLVVVDNRYSPKVAVRNADLLVGEHVELVIEFQTDEHVAPVVSAKFLEANIPIVALEIPHPGATYYGANNYAAGLMAGRYLGRWAKQKWGAAIDEILLIELEMAGPLPRSRLDGTLAGIRELIPTIEDSHVKWLDGRGRYEASLTAVRQHLRFSRSKHVLVGGVNDPSALGALRAFEEAGRAESCAVIGQNAIPEARAELRKEGTRFIGSVAYFPERYGEEVITLCLNILARKRVPPAVFVKHQLATRENIDHLYPNDALINPGELELLLLRSN